MRRPGLQRSDKLKVLPSRPPATCSLLKLNETARGLHLRPMLLTPTEVAGLLRTSRKAIYSMVERAQLPGVVRIGRRVLVREDSLLDWLRQKSTPSLER
jgi:excisionase family DNA binding protein